MHGKMYLQILKNLDKVAIDTIRLFLRLEMN